MTHLFKIVAGGNVEEVPIIDENGERITVGDMKIVDLTDKLLFFGIGYMPKSGIIPDFDPGYAYLIRKSDGAAFEVPQMFHGALGWSGWGYASTAPSPVFGFNTIPIDKDGNIFVKAGSGEIPHQTISVYKITASPQGVSANRIGTNLKNTQWNYSVDWKGNVLYVNEFSNVWCVAADGTEFKVDNISVSKEDRYGRTPSPLPFTRKEGGGFLYPDESKIYFASVNAAEKRIDLRSIYEGEFAGIFVPFGDKVLVTPFSINDRSIPSIVIRNDLSTSVLNMHIEFKSARPTKTANHLYWSDEVAVYDFDAEAEQVTTVYSLNPNVTYSGFSFADDLILFTMTDRAREKRFRCEIRGGVYSETELTPSEPDAPKVIDFVRVN